MKFIQSGSNFICFALWTAELRSVKLQIRKKPPKKQNSKLSRFIFS